jgi:hypothetical protein
MKPGSPGSGGPGGRGVALGEGAGDGEGAEASLGAGVALGAGAGEGEGDGAGDGDAERDGAAPWLDAGANVQFGAVPLVHAARVRASATPTKRRPRGRMRRPSAATCPPGSLAAVVGRIISLGSRLGGPCLGHYRIWCRVATTGQACPDNPRQMTSAAPFRTHDGKIVRLASVGNYCVSLAGRTLSWWRRDHGTFPNVGLVALAGCSGRGRRRTSPTPARQTRRKGSADASSSGPADPRARRASRAPRRRGVSQARRR